MKEVFRWVKIQIQRWSIYSVIRVLPQTPGSYIVLSILCVAHYTMISTVDLVSTHLFVWSFSLCPHRFPPGGPVSSHWLKTQLLAWLMILKGHGCKADKGLKLYRVKRCINAWLNVACNLKLFDWSARLEKHFINRFIFTPNIVWLWGFRTLAFTVVRTTKSHHNINLLTDGGSGRPGLSLRSEK